MDRLGGEEKKKKKRENKREKRRATPLGVGGGFILPLPHF